VLDLNGDGLLDVFFGGYRAPSHLWLNMGGGSFFDSSVLVAGLPSVVSCVGGDFDGDGWDDLLLDTEVPAAPLGLWRNASGQSLTMVPNGVRQPITFATSKMYAEDLDGDGDLDVATAAVAYLVGHRYWFIPNTTRHVETVPPVRAGGTFEAFLWGYPGQWMFPLVSFAPARFDLGALGVLGLDPTQGLVLPPMQLAARRTRLTLPVPRGSAGLRLFTQALVYDPQIPALTRLTNWMDDDIVQ
jgi:hypothetical protein